MMKTDRSKNVSSVVADTNRDIRLHPDRVGALPASIRQPKYDRTSLSPGIVHLGSGAFHRAHLTDFTEDAIEARFGPWGIIGINLRAPDLGAILGPQEGLYCRQLRQGDNEDTRLIGALKSGFSVLDGVDGLQPKMLKKALATATHTDIKIISMTVTEKGYCHIPSTGQLNIEHVDIIHDVAFSSEPKSVPGFVLEIIRRKFLSQLELPVFMSCDNVPGNGTTLRNCVLQLATIVHPDLVSRIEEEAVFLNSMVDRIAPATRPEDLEAFQKYAGMSDFGLVIGEPFRMWVIEKDDRAVLPAWDEVGAMIVDNVHEYEKIKMRVVNGMQTALCHLGHMTGYEFMSDVLADAVFQQFARELVLREVAPNLPNVSGVELSSYINGTVQRLENTALRHTTAQISTDGSQKIRHRLLDPLFDAHCRGMNYDGLTIAVAGWIAHLIKLSSSGDDINVSDPVLEKAGSIWKMSGGNIEKFVDDILALEEIFPRKVTAIPHLPDTLKVTVNALLNSSVHQVLSNHLLTLD